MQRLKPIKDNTNKKTQNTLAVTKKHNKKSPKNYEQKIWESNIKTHRSWIQFALPTFPAFSSTAASEVAAVAPPGVAAPISEPG